jgi:hypothetical protein
VSKLHDPHICMYCPNRMIKFFFKDKQYKKPCPNPCAPLKWINGNVARREPFVDDLKFKLSESRDYNISLSELIEDRSTALERLFEIEDIRRRGIGAMLVVGLTRNDVATLLSMSYRQILRIVKDYK